MPEGLAPSFLTKPAIKQDTKTATVQIDVAADPSPSLQWTKDGKELLNVDKIVTRLDRKGVNTYTISLDIKVDSCLPMFISCPIIIHCILSRTWSARIVAFTNVLCPMNWVQLSPI
jgi:hypothetical protein